MSPKQQREMWVPKGAWWALPAKNSLDRATATLPRLMYERMDDLSLDYTILYPSMGLRALCFPGILESDVRRAMCRALNTLHADIYREYADRMTPAAVIPMRTPEEALAEMEHAVRVLGLKVLMFADHVIRPIPGIHRDHPEYWFATNRMDTFGLESDYDYDPVWAKAVELGVAVTAHSDTWAGAPVGLFHRTSTTTSGTSPPPERRCASPSSWAG